MKLKHLLIITAIAFIALACTKSEFPKSDVLIGHWAEKKDTPDKMEMWFLDDENMIIKRNTTHYDTCTYFLNTEKQRIYLTKDNIQTNHYIQWQEKRDKLSVWGLLYGISESSNVTVFHRK